jgi:hypothetical protein
LFSGRIAGRNQRCDSAQAVTDHTMEPIAAWIDGVLKVSDDFDKLRLVKACP